jgi:L-lactate dehydrogenase complex protein LldG
MTRARRRARCCGFWTRPEAAGPEKLAADSPSFARYAAGVSAAACLVARTGSVVLTSAGAGGRRLSVMPPLHIVVARSSQVVASLDEGLEAMARDGDWSSAAVITGPSRTADIEKILVLGAHGPRRLAVVVIQ